jgi:hypothetical protein
LVVSLELYKRLGVTVSRAPGYMSEVVTDGS